jgi:hypothetical protein
MYFSFSSSSSFPVLGLLRPVTGVKKLNPHPLAELSSSPGFDSQQMQGFLSLLPCQTGSGFAQSAT